MFATGLVYPLAAFVFGSTWVFGRFIYGIGYASKGPSGRQLGGIIGHFGDIPLMAMAGRIAYGVFLEQGVPGIVAKVMNVFGKGEL